MGNDKEALHNDNSRIENVPSLKNDHTNMGYTRDSDYLQLQHFDPEGKNVEEMCKIKVSLYYSFFATPIMVLSYLVNYFSFSLLLPPLPFQVSEISQ
jgi:hypothetical protein